MLHAYALALPDSFDFRATSRIAPVVPMFHVNAWGMPHAAALTGAALILPGRHLDAASLATLFNAERVTFSTGVPTIWFGLLQHLRTSGERLTTLRKIAGGGSAVPVALTEAFREWAHSEPVIPLAKRSGGKRRVDMRNVVSAVMYVLSAPPPASSTAEA